jgi:hypothetical protein
MKKSIPQRSNIGLSYQAQFLQWITVFGIFQNSHLTVEGILSAIDPFERLIGEARSFLERISEYTCHFFEFICKQREVWDNLPANIPTQVLTSVQLAEQNLPPFNQAVLFNDIMGLLFNLRLEMENEISGKKLSDPQLYPILGKIEENFKEGGLFQLHKQHLGNARIITTEYQQNNIERERYVAENTGPTITAQQILASMNLVPRENILPPNILRPDSTTAQNILNANHLSLFKVWYSLLASFFPDNIVERDTALIIFTDPLGYMKQPYRAHFLTYSVNYCSQLITKLENFGTRPTVENVSSINLRHIIQSHMSEGWQKAQVSSDAKTENVHENGGSHATTHDASLNQQSMNQKSQNLQPQTYYTLADLEEQGSVITLYRPSQPQPNMSIQQQTILYKEPEKTEKEQEKTKPQPQNDLQIEQEPTQINVNNSPTTTQTDQEQFNQREYPAHIIEKEADLNQQSQQPQQIMQQNSPNIQISQEDQANNTRMTDEDNYKKALEADSYII